MKKMFLVALMVGAFVAPALAGPDDSSQPLITNVFATGVSVSSGSMNTVRLGVQNVKPTVVLSSPGFIPVVLANASGVLESNSMVRVSSSATAVQTVTLAGAYPALPITGMAKNTLIVLTTDNALYISTETVVGTVSWVKVGAQ